MILIISKNGGNAKRVDKSDIEKEEYLQNYIHQNPESIPVYEIEEDKKLLVLAREFPTESGPIDALATDKDGDIYIVETKRYKNPDKRMVVAQVLDYGASLWRRSNDFGDFINSIEEEVRDKFGTGFKEKAKDFFNIEDEQVGLLVEIMRSNFTDGKLKFVVLMDKMDERMKDLIVYVNQNSQFDIFAVELEYYKYDEYEIMIPKIFGVEVKKDISVSSASARRKWDEKSFFEDAQKRLSEKGLIAVKNLYEFSKNSADGINWGTGTTHSSFGPVFNKISEGKSPYIVRSRGDLLLKLGWINESGQARDFHYGEKFKELIENRKLFKIPQNYDYKESLSFRMEEWQDKVDEFIEVIKDLLKE